MKKRLVLLIAAMAAVVVAVSGVALAEKITCGFSTNQSECRGTEGDDVLRGTEYQDYMNGLGGSDTLFGREAVNGLNFLRGEDWRGDPSKDGDDTIRGGPDSDHVEWTFGGDDVIKTYRGRDSIHADEGDILDDGQVLRPIENPGIDRIYSGKGPDSVYAKDGYRDYINCGKNRNDQARFDEGLDKVVSCEITLP